MNAVLFLLGLSVSIGIAYVGLRLIFSAQADEVARQIAQEYADSEAHEARRVLKEQNVRAIASQRIAEAIAEYESFDRRASLSAVQGISDRQAAGRQL